METLKRKNFKWTSEKVERAATIIRNNPQNLNKAFMIVAEEFGIKWKAVQSSYYSKGHKLYKYREENNVLTTASGRMTQNMKNVWIKKEHKHPVVKTTQQRINQFFNWNSTYSV